MGPPTGATRVALAVGVGVVIAVASIGIPWSFGWLGGGNVPGNAGGVSGLTALGQIESELPRTPATQWILISALGIASPGPFAPYLISPMVPFAPNNTWPSWTCSQLPMISVWNASGLPSRSGNVSNGLAPFWQFLFAGTASNGTEEFMFTSYANTRIFVVGPLTSENACVSSLGLGGVDPSSWLVQPSIDTASAGPLVFDVAKPALSAIVPYALVWDAGLPAVALQGFGSTTYFAGKDWLADFYTCGQVGSVAPMYSPVAAQVYAYQDNGTPGSARLNKWSFSCSQPDFNMSLRLIGQHSRPSIQDLLTFVNSTQGGRGLLADAQGVVAWMIQPYLKSGVGIQLSPGSDECPTWVSNVSECAPPQTGWYATLSSPAGEWLDSYGMVGGTAQWVAVNVPFVSGETLTLYMSNSTIGQAHTFTFASALSYPRIVVNSVTVS